MKPITITVRSRFSEFKTFYKDFLFDSHGIHVQFYTYGDREYNFQHSFHGALIICKVIVADQNNLDIEISVPNTSNENSNIHVSYIVDEIKKKFSPAQLPIGFKNLISEDKYVEIMQERWRESERTERAEAYLSTIVLLGSILEGILLYKIKSNMEKANRSNACPKTDGKSKAYKDWTLENMIAVCHECGWISKDVKGFSDAVKEYRNFVHPWKQLEYHLDMPTKKSCRLSRDVIEIVLDDLWKNP